MPTHIEAIKRDLQNRLNLMTEKIALLNEIRARPGHQATPEEMAVLDLYQQTYDSLVRINTDGDIIALMLEAKAEKRANKEDTNTYQPFLLDTTDKLKQWMFNALINEKMSAHEPFRYDVVLQGYRGHCSSAHMEFDGTNLNLFYIDAAADTGVIEQNYNYLVRTLGEERIKKEHLRVVLPQIQYDKTSCAIFSIQHLNRLSHLSVEELMSKNLQLDGALMKNIQSISHFNDYPAELKTQFIDKKQNKTLAQHIEAYSIQCEAIDSEKVTTKNYAIDYKNYKYLVAANEKLDELLRQGNEELVKSVIDNRSSLQLTDQERETLAIRAFLSNPSDPDPDIIRMNVDLDTIKTNFVEYFIAQNNPQVLRQWLELTTEQTKTRVTYFQEERLKLLQHIRQWLKNIEPYTEHHATLHKNILQELGIFEYLIATRWRREKDDSTHDIAARIELVKEFIQQGGDINQPGGKYNLTPLTTALDSLSHVDIITFLLESGARADIKDKDGETPLDIVLLSKRHKPEVREQLILLLLQHDAIASKENLETLKQALSAEDYQKYDQKIMKANLQEIRSTDAENASTDSMTQRRSF